MSITLYDRYVRLMTWWADTAPAPRDDRGEGVISAAIAVLIMAGMAGIGYFLLSRSRLAAL